MINARGRRRIPLNRGAGIDRNGGLNLRTIGTSAFFAVVLVLAIAKETRLERGRNKIVQA